ncbi:SDR family NAD(P)-dependent oxidoreductase [Nisaea acidiphila]|uniref:SDR family NAD(P)-dependent oxidoreductase n=1 Tax=Nisaea acidiphila TaxID=1862145 RepID=A0A9J7AMZ9_9PROT|nr:SDR family NAD(P)-dependent oxidoreductase [Nisaea acidiphila]UUX48542.1 SDR family NAD(P)-dependent oxidoreductase [Nisaea acidiphila]
MNFTNKVIAVGGATGNLGAACVTKALKAGARVAALGRAQSSLARTFPDAPGNDALLLVDGVDLVDPATAADAISRIVDRFGRLDAVLNTVGGFAMTPVEESDTGEWEKLHAMNCGTALALTRAAIPALRTAGGGAIVHVGALAALDAPAKLGAYAASKAALHRLVEAAAAELRADEIRVNAVLPGTIDTPQNRKAMPKADTSKWVSPAAIADAMLMLAGSEARAVTGALIPVTGRG